MVILCRGNEVSMGDLPSIPGSPSPEWHSARNGHGKEDWPPLPPGGLSLVDLEKQVIERALKLNKGNITRTALYLGVPRHVLVYRLEKYEIER
jgi:two-component system NtrC family response regulator